MIRTTEVDGVRTLIAPSTGPLRAGLVFRVGQADETAATRGITHLVEHLALHRQGLTDYHYNGSTCQAVTHFHMQGSAEAVVAFLSGVCTSLTDLPMDRMETEKTLLRTEEAGRTSTVVSNLPLWRYGAQGYGLPSLPEWGLPQLSAGQVQQWAATWFTRDNVVLWIVGSDVPPGLRLPLRPGAGPRRLPRVTSALPVTPAYFTSNAKGVAFETVVARRPAVGVYAKVLERELFRSLRQEGGYSYTTEVDTDHRGDGATSVIAVADALPDQKGAVVGGLIDVLMKLKVGRVEAADLDAVRSSVREAAAHPDAEAHRVTGMAVDVLTGHPVQELDAFVAGICQVTAGDVHAVAEEAMASALLMVPQPHRADWAGFTAAPTSSTGVVTGTSYPAVRGTSSIVIGQDGVSAVHDGVPATVGYRECAVALAWPDGARELIGNDAIAVRIEPTLLQVPAAALAAVDAALPPAVMVWMPARPADAIPRPSAPERPATPGAGRAATPGAGRAATPGAGRAAGPMSTGAKAGGVMLGVLALLLGGLSLLCTIGVIVSPDRDMTVNAIMAGCPWSLFLLTVVPLTRLVRRYLHGRRPAGG